MIPSIPLRATAITRLPPRAAVIIATGLVALVFVALDVDGAIRTVPAVAFSLFGPGLAIVGRLRLKDPVEQAVLVVPFSLAASALVAGAALYLGWWSPVLVLGILVIGSSGLALTGLVRPDPPASAGDA